MLVDAPWIHMSADVCKPDTFQFIFSADYFTTLKKSLKNLQTGEGGGVSVAVMLVLLLIYLSPACSSFLTPLPFCIYMHECVNICIGMFFFSILLPVETIDDVSLIYLCELTYLCDCIRIP